MVVEVEINKPYNNCGVKGRLEKDCWRKNPENAPDWYKKSEGAGASVKIMLASVELKKKAVETSSIEAEKQSNTEVKQNLRITKAVLEKI